MRHLRKPRRIALPAAFAAVTALALALGPAGQFLHFVEVTHVVCAEHGELVHAEPSRGVLEAGHTAAPHVDPGERGDGAGHDHHHCGLATHERDQAESASGLQHVSAVSSGEHARAPVGAPAPSARALYLVAPKGSPPA